MARASTLLLGGLITALVAFVLPAVVTGAGRQINVLAAENFYGDIARQIGGDRVAVTSILSNPDQDPHLFEISPTIVRKIAAADIVVYSGADYDPWIEKLLKGTERPGRIALAAADLANKKRGDDPHVWYDPSTMPAVARALSAALSTVDPAHKADYAARLKAFLASLDPLNEKIAAIREQVCRCAGRGDRAGVRLHGRSARSRHARPAFSTRHHEQYRAKRPRSRRVRE